MSDDKVIQAFPNRAELPECPVDVQRRMSYCDHKKIRLVEHDRAVVCAECGATLDPFGYLLRGAEAMRMGWSNYRHVCQQLEERREQVAKLDKEKTRLQAAIRALKKKAGDGDVLDLRRPL